MSSSALRIAENLQRVRERIATAAAQCGRREQEITLVAVTKYVGLAEVDQLVVLGQREFGESRPQVLCKKASQTQHPRLLWHLVGHLQANKVRRTVPFASLIHSVDTVRLLSLIDAQGVVLGRRVQILLEVNVSGDAAKHGFSPHETRLLVPTLARYPNVWVRGLMTMASREGGLATAQSNFKELRELRDALTPLCFSGVSLNHLSMGMSHDLEMAIKEGATIVRIGSALFDGLIS